MISIIRTDSNCQDFVDLVVHLDQELKIRDGEDHSFYAQYNKIDKIKYSVVAYDNQVPVGCGAIKEYNNKTMEVKRMFVMPGYRGKGIAKSILTELEKWAGELNYKNCILETGVNQPEAINLYCNYGYNRIPNYGQYKNAVKSVCFQKSI